MTEREYIDFISGDIQDLINALDNDPNTSAKVKGKAKGIQNRINKFYEFFEDYGDWIKCADEMPEAGVIVLVACYGSDMVIPMDGETVWQTYDRQKRNIKRVTTGFIDEDGCWDEGDGLPLMIAPTYWQPLPEAPDYKPEPDDVDTGLTWQELCEKAKAKTNTIEHPQKKPIDKSRTYIGKDGIERTWDEVFEAIFNDDEERKRIIGDESDDTE